MVTEMNYEIWLHGQNGYANRCYAATLEGARALVIYHLNAGRYDSGSVFGPEGGMALFRARRWYSPHYAAVVDNPAPEPRRPLRVVPQGVNPYEFAARVAKARKLADGLLRHGITYRDALLMDDAMWRLAAAGCGVIAPSTVTQVMALEEMAMMERAA